MIDLHISWSLSDIKLYLGNKYGYTVKRTEVWYSRFTYKYWAYDAEGNKVGNAIDLFESDFKKMILSKMLSTNQ